jgi:hypothetical protein
MKKIGDENIEDLSDFIISVDDCMWTYRWRSSFVSSTGQQTHWQLSYTHLTSTAALFQLETWNGVSVSTTLHYIPKGVM